MAIVPSREHSLRGRIAAEHSRRDPDPEVIADLRREHAVVKIEDHARAVFAAAPELTSAQRLHLAEVMLGGGTSE